MDLEECILITDAALSQLAAHCPCLESLSLSHCELITDEGIRHLGSSPCASESLTVLGMHHFWLLIELLKREYISPVFWNLQYLAVKI
jgi:F-box and leucine-rich repeat protein 2/20